MATTGYTREQLAGAVRASATLSEALTRLGRKPTSGRRRYVRKLLERWDIDASCFTPVRPRHPEGSHHERLVPGDSAGGRVAPASKGRHVR